MKIRSLLVLPLFFFASFLHGQNADIRLLRSIYLDRNEKLEPAFLLVTRSVTPISIAAPVSQISYGLIFKDETVLRNGYTGGASLALANILSTSIKYAVNRDRPYITHTDILQKTRADLPSFPSGHTSSAFATATSLSLAYPEWYVIVPSFTWAGVVGYSRMFLGVHYPSDVLFGAIIGTGAAFLCYKVGQRIN